MVQTVNPTCPFLTSSGQTNIMNCNDGSSCDVITNPAGWNCCGAHGGRKQCPLERPVMCGTLQCNGDYCCETQARCLETYGSVRPCNGPVVTTSTLPATTAVTRTMPTV